MGQEETELLTDSEIAIDPGSQFTTQTYGAQPIHVQESIRRMDSAQSNTSENTAVKSEAV